MTPLNVLLETGLHDTHETHENKEANNNNNQIIYLEAVHTGTIQLEIFWNLSQTNSEDNYMEPQMLQEDLESCACLCKNSGYAPVSCAGTIINRQEIYHKRFF